jgi:hypothetical protein
MSSKLNGIPRKNELKIWRNSAEIWAEITYHRTSVLEFEKFSEE